MSTTPVGSVFGEIRFIEKRGVQDERGRYVAKRSDSRKAYPEVKLQGRDLVQVVGSVAPFASLGTGTRVKFVLSSPRGEKGPSSGTVRENQANFRAGTVWGL